MGRGRASRDRLIGARAQSARTYPSGGPGGMCGVAPGAACSTVILLLLLEGFYAFFYRCSLLHFLL
jgi:hypothetical protein